MAVEGARFVPCAGVSALLGPLLRSGRPIRATCPTLRSEPRLPKNPIKPAESSKDIGIQAWLPCTTDITRRRAGTWERTAAVCPTGLRPGGTTRIRASRVVPICATSARPIFSSSDHKASFFKTLGGLIGWRWTCLQALSADRCLEAFTVTTARLRDRADGRGSRHTGIRSFGGCSERFRSPSPPGRSLSGATGCHSCAARTRAVVSSQQIDYGGFRQRIKFVRPGAKPVALPEFVDAARDSIGYRRRRSLPTCSEAVSGAQRRGT
jgi:hypothetical protein